MRPAIGANGRDPRDLGGSEHVAALRPSWSRRHRDHRSGSRASSAVRSSPDTTAVDARTHRCVRPDAASRSCQGSSVVARSFQMIVHIGHGRVCSRSRSHMPAGGVNDDPESRGDIVRMEDQLEHGTGAKSAGAPSSGSGRRKITARASGGGVVHDAGEDCDRNPQRLDEQVGCWHRRRAAGRARHSDSRPGGTTARKNAGA